jgi:hypothetical protein
VQQSGNQIRPNDSTNDRDSREDIYRKGVVIAMKTVLVQVKERSSCHRDQRGSDDPHQTRSFFPGFGIVSVAARHRQRWPRSNIRDPNEIDAGDARHEAEAPNPKVLHSDEQSHAPYEEQKDGQGI